MNRLKRIVIVYFWLFYMCYFGFTECIRLIPNEELNPNLGVIQAFNFWFVFIFMFLTIFIEIMRDLKLPKKNICIEILVCFSFLIIISITTNIVGYNYWKNLTLESLWEVIKVPTLVGIVYVFGCDIITTVIKYMIKKKEKENEKTDETM